MSKEFLNENYGTRIGTCPNCLQPIFEICNNGDLERSSYCSCQKGGMVSDKIIDPDPNDNEEPFLKPNIKYDIIEN